MVIEYRIVLDGTVHSVIVSDEPEALLAAQAAGRAMIGVEEKASGPDLSFVPYIVSGFEDVGEELAEMVLRRWLGLPWTITATKRLVIREFVKEDADRIPLEEYGGQERVFRSRELMALYIEKQYGFYEYGTWALTEKESGRLVGMAGVSNPRLSGEMEEMLGRADSGSRPRTDRGLRSQADQSSNEAAPWLELGYHVFTPFRRKGYAGEALASIRDYAHDVLKARLCALIDKENQASRVLAEGLGLRCIKETDIQSWKGQLLYAEHWLPRPDKADS